MKQLTRTLFFLTPWNKNRHFGVILAYLFFQAGHEITSDIQSLLQFASGNF